jgi:hypothetical protein
MRPIDTVLGRLDNPKPTGRDRWRSICPSCGGSNASALSVGIRDDDAVLITSFKGCAVAQVLVAMGLEMHDLYPSMPEPGGGRPALKRRAMVSARQAIDLIEFETLLVWTAAHNLTAGHALTPDDLARLDVASQRIQAVIEEVRS